MRVLVVAESPPTLDAVHGNGSTLIPAQVLPRLPQDVELDLVWYADRPSPPAPDVLARCDTAVQLELRPSVLGIAAQAVSSLPRASWQRMDGRRLVRRLSERADAVYLHGLHTFGHAQDLAAPFLAHEVDPWSAYWAERAEQRTGARAWYDRDQARRARRLERQVGAIATRYVVVNEDDAARLGATLHRQVDAVPNGVDGVRLRPRDPGSEERDLLVFVGTLDYSPNVAAVRELCLEVLPLVRRHRPSVRLVVAGRRPVSEVRELAGDGIEVLGPVDDVRSVYARGAVAVYPGAMGRGTKNTVLEALQVGCPVVASAEAGRGVPKGMHMRVGSTPAELAGHVLDLLDDEGARRRASAAAVAMVADLPDWDAAAASYDELLRATAKGV